MKAFKSQLRRRPRGPLPHEPQPNAGEVPGHGTPWSEEHPRPIQPDDQPRRRPDPGLETLYG